MSLTESLLSRGAVPFSFYGESTCLLQVKKTCFPAILFLIFPNKLFCNSSDRTELLRFSYYFIFPVRIIENIQIPANQIAQIARSYSKSL